MSRVFSVCACVALFAMGSLRPAKSQSTAQAAPPNVQYRAVLNKYCVTCHNEKAKVGGLSLAGLDLDNIPAGAETWEKVIRKVQTGAMPPAGAPRPDKGFYGDFPDYLVSAIDRAAAARPNAGRPPIHRLNRTEYANAVRDFLAVDVDVESLLPVDDSGFGFDNNGDVLSVSPVLLERYMSAARKITRLAIGDRTMKPSRETYEVSDTLTQEDRMSEELPLGSRGGITVQHNFTADGEYTIKVTLKRDGVGDGGYIRGVGVKRQLDVRLDRKRIKLYSVGGERFGPSDITSGSAILVAGDPRQEDYERHGADADLEVRIPVTAGPHTVRVAFLTADTSLPEGAYRERRSTVRRGKQAEPWVDTVTVAGPYNAKGFGETPSRRKIFSCRPTEGDRPPQTIPPVSFSAATDEACAKTILSTLAHRAYRRPVTKEDTDALLVFYRAGRAEGGFEAGIGSALERLLSGPEFLFRIEREPAGLAPGATYRISDLDLAARLSFFLWNSIPDDQLLDAAERGKLRESAALEQQARRMMHDPRFTKVMVDNFFGQWLALRHVPGLSPDLLEFPDFDGNLRDAFAQETNLFLEYQLHEDRPLIDLLDASYTFVNERLALHYGIPNVYGSSFRRVEITDDNRKGLLGQGSILSLTSYPTRTSVVLRGKWLLENILGTPPPAPPPNVPALKDRSDDGKIKSVRQSMEEHRANPACASCHLRMDPLGFALENFNAVGQWRTTEGESNTRIDSSGVLADGSKFQGAAELRKLLVSQSGQFALTVTTKLLTFAMGRGAESYDQPAVRKIIRDAGPDYRWSALVLGVIKSEPFQMRSTPQP